MPEAAEVAGLSQPHVLRTYDDLWHLWVATPQSESPYLPSIRYATSTDGISWEWDSCLDLPLSQSLPWAQQGISDPTVLIAEDGSFRMWFSALGEEQGSLVSRIGVTEGTCESGWSPSEVALHPGEKQSWETFGATAPTVWRDGTVWKMVFSATGVTAISAIGYATSADGITWIRSPANPVLTRIQTAGGWDTKGIHSPTVVELSPIVDALFFAGDPVGERSRLARAFAQTQ